MKLKDIFDIKIGTSLDLNALELDDNGINYVSRTKNNNGVSAKVKRISNIEPLPAGSITIPTVGNSTLDCSIQPEVFYSSQNIFYGIAKKELSLVEKLYYCECLRLNKFKYNYGRPADRTLKDIELPDTIPDWVYKIDLKKYLRKPIKLKGNPKSLLPTKTKLFKLTDLFTIVRGKGPSVREAEENAGDIPRISATSLNNGVVCYTSIKAEHEGNCLTIAADGEPGITFYQPKPFNAQHVQVLIPKFELTKNRAMYLIPLIEANKFKHNYGYALSVERLEKFAILLPEKSGDVDWEYIDKKVEELIKGE